MQFDVYCDESCPEVFSDVKSHKFLILGGLWMPTDYRENFKSDIKALKTKYNYHTEIKWNKVTAKTVTFFNDLVKYFFSSDKLRFRALTVESNKIDYVQFSSGDPELNFYKFYYQLIHHWILDFNDYYIFLDYKVNRERYRIQTLKKVLISSNLSSNIKNVQSLPSKESLGIQLTDLFIGSVNGKFNSQIKSEAKLEVISSIESYLKGPIIPTPKSEEKFNVFNINLQGGW